MLRAADGAACHDVAAAVPGGRMQEWLPPGTAALHGATHDVAAAVPGGRTQHGCRLHTPKTPMVLRFPPSNPGARICNSLTKAHLTVC